jgi:hypothetical protein
MGSTNFNVNERVPLLSKDWTHVTLLSVADVLCKPAKEKFCLAFKSSSGSRQEVREPRTSYIPLRNRHGDIASVVTRNDDFAFCVHDEQSGRRHGRNFRKFSSAVPEFLKGEQSLETTENTNPSTNRVHGEYFWSNLKHFHRASLPPGALQIILFCILKFELATWPERTINSHKDKSRTCGPRRVRWCWPSAEL